MTGHYYSECFGMVSETGITFLIVCACVCFSFYCLQFLALYFWGVQKQEEGYIPHFQWQVQPENCITHAQLLPCRGSSVQPVAALSTVDAGQCLCTWTSLSWKGQKELDVKTKQCSACVGHSQSWVCGAASLWVRDRCWVAVKAEDGPVYYCELYQHSMLRPFYTYLKKKKSQNYPSLINHSYITILLCFKQTTKILILNEYLQHTNKHEF